MNLIIIFVIATYVIAIVLFVRAGIFYGEQHLLFKTELRMGDIFAFRLGKIFFVLALILSVINIIL